MSDPKNTRKTLIDFVYFRRTPSEQTYAEIVRKIDIKKLRGYLKNYKLKTAKTVMKIVKNMLFDKYA